jgi:hypothetical protein
MGGSLQFIAMRRLSCFPYNPGIQFAKSCVAEVFVSNMVNGAFAERNFSTFILFHCFWAFLLFIHIVFSTPFCRPRCGQLTVYAPRGCLGSTFRWVPKQKKINKNKKKSKKSCNTKYFDSSLHGFWSHFRNLL